MYEIYKTRRRRRTRRFPQKKKRCISCSTKKNIFKEGELLFTVSSKKSRIRNGGGAGVRLRMRDDEDYSKENITSSSSSSASDSLVQVAQSIAEHAIRNVSATGVAIVKKIGDKVDTVVDYGITSFLGENLSNESIEQIGKRTADNLKKMARIGAEVVKDEEAMEAFKELGEVLGEAMKNIMQTLKKPLNQVTREGLDMASDTSKTVVSTAAKTGVSLVGVAIAPIPFVSGIYNMFVIIGQSFNSFMELSKKGSKNISSMLDIMNNVVSEILPHINTGVANGKKIKAKLESVINRLSKSDLSTF